MSLKDVRRSSAVKVSLCVCLAVLLPAFAQIALPEPVEISHHLQLDHYLGPGNEFGVRFAETRSLPRCACNTVLSQEGDDFLVAFFVEDTPVNYWLEEYMDELKKINRKLKPLGWRHDLLNP
jgi:hypothetical protein